MTHPATGFTLREGTEVFDAAGDKVGEIVQVTPAYVVVEKGFFFPSDSFVPLSAIAGQTADGAGVRLRVTKNDALAQGWEIAPTASGGASAAPYDASGVATYAAAHHAPSADSGSPALGGDGYMGESATSPGLGADLTARGERIGPDSAE